MAAKQPARKRIPPEIEARVLIRSARRCALCFHVDRDFTEKQGQVAHLDKRRANNVEDNLAFLCQRHHSLYDSTTSQHKNYTIHEVKVARESLYRWVKKGMPKDRPKKSKRKTRDAKASPSPSRPGVHRQPRSNAPAEGPVIVVDYEYAEDSNEHHDANRPLVIRNISSVPAYNVRVLPLVTDHGTIEFDPALIPYIEPAQTKNVFADIISGPLISKRRLPTFLYQSYKDTSVNELFGTKTFVLRVQYRGTSAAVHETECELLFRPWKKETKIGVITRRIVPDGKPGAEFPGHTKGEQSRKKLIAPSLEFEGWHAGQGRYPAHWADGVPTWVAINNPNDAVPMTARNVAARLEFVNSAGTLRFVVPQAHWFDMRSIGKTGLVESWRSDVDIDGGDAQSFVLFVTDAQNRLAVCKNANEPIGVLDYGHWSVTITVSCDNAEGFEGTLGFTLGKRTGLREDTPYFVKNGAIAPLVKST